jgi:hypothetical protein
MAPTRTKKAAAPKKNLKIRTRRSSRNKVASNVDNTSELELDAEDPGSGPATERKGSAKGATSTSTGEDAGSMTPSVQMVSLADRASQPPRGMHDLELEREVSAMKGQSAIMHVDHKPGLADLLVNRQLH